MKATTWGAWVLLLSVTAATIALVLDHPDKINAVVMVRADRATGSGFAVGPSRVVTNRHVVANRKSVAVMLPTGTIHVATGRWLAQDRDLAVLWVDPPLPQYLDVDCGWPTRGTPIRAYGHPLGVQWVEHRGYVSSDIPVARDRVVALDLAVNRGMSGGPVIGPWGRVVAVIVGTRGQPNEDGEPMVSNITIAAPGSDVCRALKAATQAKREHETEVD